jgi:hypothetical protein
MEDKNKLILTIERIILGIHLILTSSVLSGGIIVLFFGRLEFWPNLLATILTSVIIYRVYYNKILQNNIKINVNYIIITILILLLLLGITYLRVHYKMFNCSADLGWHIYYTFKIKQSYNLTEFSSILLPFQFSTFNYPGVYFFLNLFFPLNFSLNLIPYINIMFNFILFIFYSLIGIVISLITVYIIENFFGQKSLWPFFAGYIIYLLPDIPSDYILRGNLPDIIGFFYLYSSIYFIIILLNTSFKNLIKFSIISTLTSYFIHPYATLYFFIIDLFIFLYLFIKLHTKLFKKILQIDLIMYSLLIIFEILILHPLSPLNVLKVLSTNNWRQYVLYILPISFQFSYLQLSKLRLPFDLFLSSSVIFLFTLLPFIKVTYRIKLFKLLLLLYIPYYILYLLPIVGIQIEPNRFVWRSFDFLPLFLLIIFFMFKFINNIRLISLFSLILTVIYIFTFLTYSNAIYAPNYGLLNTCGNNPEIIYNITHSLSFLLRFSNHSIVIFADQVPYCTYFELLNLLNPSIKVYPLSSSAIYTLSGNIQTNLRQLYNEYINCKLFDNYIYIYMKNYDYSSCYNYTIYTNYGLTILVSNRTS